LDRKTYMKAYREAHKEQIKEWSKAYNEAHKEQQKAHYEAHRKPGSKPRLTDDQVLRTYYDNPGDTWAQLAEKLGLKKATAKTRIGLALMQECRESPTCPMKALLPEYEENTPGKRRGNEPTTFSPWPKKEPASKQTTLS